MISEPETLQTAVAARVRELVQKDTDGRIAKSGIKGSTLDRMKRGANEPSLTNLTMIADAMGVSLDWLAGRESYELEPTIPGGAIFIKSKQSVPHTAPEGFVSVPALQVHAQAEPEPIAAKAPPAETVVIFRDKWLRNIGLTPERAEAMTAVGDSMEPTIHDGDLLLVDRSIDRVINHGIYVVVYNSTVLLKRIQMRPDGSLTLISDNPIYQPDSIPAKDSAGLIVEGRVRWFGRMV